MMEITINVNGLDNLAEAINALASVLSNGNLMPAQAQSTPALPVSNAQAAAPVPQVTVPQNTPVPTTAVSQSYTQDQIAIAMTGLMDAGKRDTLMGILQQFGVQSLLQIPAERYPEVALKLREAGANI